MTRRGWILFAAMSVIWGIPYLLIKVAVREVPPASLVLGRTAIGAFLLVPVAAARGQLRPALTRWRPILVFTVVEMAVPWVLLSAAERRLPSSLTAMLVAAVPLVGAGLATVARHGDRLAAGTFLGLLTGLAGVGVLVGFDLHGADLAPCLGVAVTVVGYATGPLILDRYLSDLPGLGVMAASLAICATCYVPLALLDPPPAWPAARPALAVLTLGVVCTAVAFLVFFHLIAEVGPLRSTVITYVNPAVAAILGIVYLGERGTTATWAGFALILTGSYLATQGRRRAPEPVLVAEP